jgi:NhaP-type Na+/H+ or K+/H+ antiporter
MNKKSFFKNLGTVLMFSFLGTFIAIFSSSIMFWLVGITPLSPDFTWKEAFAFGSLISATDPVSVLASFKEMNADADLYAIIFGESIFNDAVAIVMYQTVMLAGNENISHTKEFLGGLWQFTLIFGGSLLVGAISALVISFQLKRQHFYT